MTSGNIREKITATGYLRGEQIIGGNMDQNGFKTLGLSVKNILSFSPYIPKNMIDLIRLKTAGGFGLVKGEKVSVGALLYNASDGKDTVILESLFVDGDERNKGGGTALYDAFEEKMVDEGFKEILVHTFPAADDGLKSFLESKGFVFLDLTFIDEDNPIVSMRKAIGDSIPREFEMPYGAFLITRINGLSKILSDFGDGYEHRVYSDMYDSSIRLIREDDKREVILRYSIDDTEDPGNWNYHLSIISGIPLKSLDAPEKERLSKWKDESSLISFSEDENGMFYARAEIIEGEGLTEPAVLKTVLDGFITELDELKAL